jgi:hypothetical protein
MTQIYVPDDIDDQSVLAALGDEWMTVNMLREKRWPGLEGDSANNTNDKIRQALSRQIKAGKVRKFKILAYKGCHDSYHVVPVPRPIPKILPGSAAE